MRKLLTMLAAVLFVMILPMPTYAASAHTTKHTVKHTAKHTVRHTAKHKHRTKHSTKHRTKHKTKHKTKHTTKHRRKHTVHITVHAAPAKKTKQYGKGTVQGTSQYVIVGTMQPTKEFTWNDLMKHGSNWLNYTLANSKTTWHDPAKY